MFKAGLLVTTLGFLLSVPLLGPAGRKTPGDTGDSYDSLQKAGTATGDSGVTRLTCFRSQGFQPRGEALRYDEEERYMRHHLQIQTYTRFAPTQHLKYMTQWYL